MNEYIAQHLPKGKEKETYVGGLLEMCIGGKTEPASTDDDMFRHIDLFWTTPKGIKVSIDVKGERKNKRGDKDTDNKIQWVEFVNVNGDNGWLRGGADYIAFMHAKEVLFVRRDRLLEFATAKVRGKEISSDLPKEPYVPYRRNGRKDVIAKVLRRDLVGLSSFIITLQVLTL